MRVVVFGTYDAARHPRIGVMMEGLIAHGHDILELNEPLGLDADAKVRVLREPWRIVGLAARLLHKWWRLWSRARQLEPPDVVVVGYMGHFDVHLARRLWSNSVIVLDQLIFAEDTARDRGETSRVKMKLLRAVDRSALRAADIIVLDTEEHRQFVPESMHERCIVIPVGAADVWFAKVDSAGGSQLEVVFFGLFAPLQGAPIMGEAVGRLGDCPVHFTIVGRGQDYERTRKLAAGNARVHWIDWLDPAELVEVVANSDVCLGIFGRGSKGLRVVPNKVYQGAAAGCVIITSNSTPQVRALESAGLYVPPGDPERLEAALRELASSPSRVAELKQATRELAERKFRPATVTARLVELLENRPVA